MTELDLDGPDRTSKREAGAMRRLERRAVVAIMVCRWSCILAVSKWCCCPCPYPAEAGKSSSHQRRGPGREIRLLG